MMKLTEQDIRKMTGALRFALAKARLDDYEKQQMIDNFQAILNEYREHFGEDTEVRYRIRKRLSRLELILSVKGERWNIYEEGSHTDDLNLMQKVHSLSFSPAPMSSGFYFRGYNVVILRSSFFKIRANILKQPVVWALILGVSAGLICRLLPPSAAEFVADSVAKPSLDIVLSLLAGIMGPVIFLSLLTSITTLDSINELNHMGFKLVGRFVREALLCLVFAGVIGLLLLIDLSKGAASFEPSTIVDLLLGIIPTSLFTPFVENNIPQLVVLGFVLGAVLLLLGERTRLLTNVLQQTKEWIDELMNLALKLIILVPFLSIFRIIAKGETSKLLEGWKYILAVYICFVVCLAIKLVRVSLKCKISISDLLRKLKPLAVNSFSTGSVFASLRKCYETSKTDLRIKEGFTSFFIPMSQAMLWPSSPIEYTLAPLFAATLTKTPVSISFLVVLVILSLQLSLASPGLEAACTVIFPSLGIAAEYVGIFSAYDVFIRNAEAAFDVTYQMLEQIAAANALQKIEPQTNDSVVI